jgi:adiponectin receptor
MECYHRPFIYHGYRPNLSVNEALRSVLSMHNETMNIWSHLIAFFCVLGAAIVIFYEYETSPIDGVGHMWMGVYLFSAGFCLLCSSLYHWFSCVSTHAFYSLLKVDLCGISILITGSYYPAVYYGELCIYPNQRRLIFFCQR